jgi:hypothetical protein
MSPAELEKMTKQELLKLARARKLKVTAAMRKAELVRALRRDDAKNRTAAAKRKTVKVKQPSGGAKAKTSRAAKKRPPTAKAKAKRAASKAAKGKAAVKRTAKAKAAKKKTAGARKTAKAAAKRTTAPKAAAPRRAAPKKRPAAKPAERTKPPAKAPDRMREPAARKRKIAADTIRQKAVASKYYLGAEERVMPPVEAMDIPPGYDIDRIACMVRDPRWLFTYWEVTRGRLRELESRFSEEWSACRLVLRIFDLSGKTPKHYNIVINPDARNWYLSVEPERRYQVAIGIISPTGKFVKIAVSNIVETPRAGISDVEDDRWMIPDELFDRIFAASGGHDMQASSAELRELLERRLLEQISSGAISSMASEALPARERERGFRLWVATELILYGGTEPNAVVTVQGKEIKLRSDGTFSFRFALPDGKIEIPVSAVSGDRVEERSIDTSVNKKSHEKEPVVR